MSKNTIDYTKITNPEILHARILELESLLEIPDAAISLFGLLQREMLIMNFLANRVSVTREQIYLILYNGWSNVDSRIIDVMICKIRKKVPAHLAPVTDYGRGYHMETQARLEWKTLVNRKKQSDGNQNQPTR